MKRFKILPIVFLALFFVSCAYNTSLVNTSYDTLQVSATAYDTSMKVVADLYARDEISDEEKQEIKEIASTYSQVHNAAVEALADYQDTKDVDDKERLEKQMAAASEALSKLLNIIRPYIEEGNHE